MSADMVQTAALIGEQAHQLRNQVGRFVLNLRSAGSDSKPPVSQQPGTPAAPAWSETESWRAVAS
jgi:hypothetical protein